MKYYYLKRHKGIFKYFQNGKTKYGFRLRFYIGHKQKEKSRRGFSNLADAIKAYDNLSNLKLGKGNKSSITVKAWCNHYLRMIKPPVRKISTYTSYKDLLTEHIIHSLGNYELNQLKLDVYQNHLNQLLKQGLSRRTVVETNARFQAVINYAVKSRYIKVNPIRFATISNVNNKPRKVIMNDNQLAVFNRTLRHHSIQLQVLFFTLELTGMRIGELLGLSWDDIDLKNHVIHINHTRDMLGIRTPKTPHSRRKFTITNGLNQLLSKYAIYCKKHYHVESRHTLMMRGKQGNPLLPNLPARLLKKLLVEAGLNNLVGRFTPHSFRHMLASRLIDKGISPITVSQVLGHANPDITLKIYAQAKNGVTPNLEQLMNK